MSELVRTLCLWKWRARWKCHDNLFPCQYIDRPNDNHGRRWGQGWG